MHSFKTSSGLSQWVVSRLWSMACLVSSFIGRDPHKFLHYHHAVMYNTSVSTDSLLSRLLYHIMGRVQTLWPHVEPAKSIWNYHLAIPREHADLWLCNCFSLKCHFLNFYIIKCWENFFLIVGGSFGRFTMKPHQLYKIRRNDHERILTIFRGDLSQKMNHSSTQISCCCSES